MKQTLDGANVGGLFGVLDFSGHLGFSDVSSFEI
jgi:hypothetical protein